MAADRAFLLELGGWDEGVARGLDFATALRIADNPPLGIVRRPLVGIRKHEGNFSGDVRAMNLGDAAVLEYVLASRAELAPLAPAIRASIARRRLDALNTAFAERNFDSVLQIAERLGRLGGRERIKYLVSALPQPLRELSAWALMKRSAM
jgi:hypothetical protein